MKRIIFIMLLIVALVAPSLGQATRWNINSKPNANWFSGAAGRDIGWEWMKDVDVLIAGAAGGTFADTGGTIYYVCNNNGDDDFDGLSWTHAFLTIGAAMEESHGNISESGKGRYANRNRIYVKGDDFDEDWTDLAQKTDVIGVGSDDGNKGPRILGNHVIDAVASGYNYMGCRFINMTFVNQTAADIFVVPTGHHGLEWIGCRFESNSSTLAPSALDITACSDTRIVGCEFISSVNPMWSGGAIDFGAGLCQNTDILGNFIDAAIGITIDSSATGLSSRIEGNTIYASTLTVDDNSDVFYVCNNSLISDTYGKVAFDFYIPHAQGNMLTTAVRTTPIPYTNECAGAVAAAQRGAFGVIYYCDGNMAASGGDGLTWETAFQSLVTALATSHANIAVSAQRNWAARNTIYVRGDALTHDLVLLAQKTDVVGVGNSSVHRSELTGHHVIPNTFNGGGCRWYNFLFTDDDAGGVLWQLADQDGIQFHDCTFRCDETDTIGLKMVNSTQNAVVDNCRFILGGAGHRFSTAAIQVDDGSEAAWNLTISNNYITATGIGIDWNETLNVDCWIVNNIMRTDVKCIDSGDATELMVIGNRLQTLTNAADNTSNNFNILYAIDNIVTGAADHTLYIPSPNDF